MSGYIAELRDAIEKTTPRLKHLSDRASETRPNPGKWSPREVKSRQAPAMISSPNPR